MSLIGEESLDPSSTSQLISDISVLIVCNKTGGTIKGDKKNLNKLHEAGTDIKLLLGRIFNDPIERKMKFVRQITIHYNTFLQQAVPISVHVLVSITKVHKQRPLLCAAGQWRYAEGSFCQGFLQISMKSCSTRWYVIYIRQTMNWWSMATTLDLACDPKLC